MLRKRLSGIPLAYILGTKEFYGRQFFITPDVLIPRPETEDLIDIALSVLLNELPSHKTSPSIDFFSNSCYNIDNAISNSCIDTILDIGTGSGCIAITLALELQKLLRTKSIPKIPQILALDNSPTALKIAQQNAHHLITQQDTHRLTSQHNTHHSGANITFLHSDLLQNYHPQHQPPFTSSSAPPPSSSTAPLTPSSTLIIANLPYVDPTWDWLSSELTHEPSNALYAPDHGLALIKRLIRETQNLHATTTPQRAIAASQHLATTSLYHTTTTPSPTTPSLYLLLETDPCQHPSIISYATQHHFHHLLTHHFALLFRI